MSARPFTDSEFSHLSAHFSAAGRTRDVLLLKLGCGTGYRISEILALRVRDVWTGHDVAKEVTIARRNLKGGRGAHSRSVRGRRVPLAEPVREAILWPPGEDRDRQPRPGALLDHAGPGRADGP